MKFKFSHLFSVFSVIVFLASLSTTKAMEIPKQDDYFEKVGISAKPLKIAVNNDITQKCIAEFDDFQKSRHKSKNESSDYMIIKTYILNVLKIQHQDFSQIEEWISKPVNTHSSTERSLSLSLDSLARLLSIKTPTPVTLVDIEAYLKQSNERLKAGERFDTLRYFATKVLQFTPMALDGLSSWLLTSYDRA